MTSLQLIFSEDPDIDIGYVNMRKWRLNEWTIFICELIEQKIYF